MIAIVVFLIAAVVFVLTLLGYVPWLIALPAIGIVIAVFIGFAMRRTGAEPPR
jgi:hypothetical protein